MKEVLSLFGNDTELSRQTGIALSAIKRIKAGKVKPQTKTIGKLNIRLKDIKHKIDQHFELCDCGVEGIWNEYEECYHCECCKEDDYYHCEHCNEFTPYKDADSFPNGDTICSNCRASN